MYDYEILKEKLNWLVSYFAGQLKDKEIDEINEFIRYGEYGVAYDLLCAVIAQEGQAIPADIYEMIVALGQQMELEEEVWMKLAPLKSEANH